jgi:hypothetical protein
MNYTELNRNATDKVSRYTLAHCEYAIADIHATLAVTPYGDDMAHPYVAKLYAELDAVRDRRMVLQSKTLRQRRAIASAHALIDSL